MDSGEPSIGAGVPEHTTATDHSPSASNWLQGRFLKLFSERECWPVHAGSSTLACVVQQPATWRSMIGASATANPRWMSFWMMANAPRDGWAMHRVTGAMRRVTAGLLRSAKNPKNSPWRARAMQRGCASVASGAPLQPCSSQGPPLSISPGLGFCRNLRSDTKCVRRLFVLDVRVPGGTDRRPPAGDCGRTSLGHDRPAKSRRAAGAQWRHRRLSADVAGVQWRHPRLSVDRCGEDWQTHFRDDFS